MDSEKLEKLADLSRSIIILVPEKRDPSPQDVKKLFQELRSLSMSLMEGLDLRGEIKDAIPLSNLGEFYNSVRYVHEKGSSYSGGDAQNLKQSLALITKTLEEASVKKSGSENSTNAKTIFYSWQSDLPNSTNRGFIQKALERAVKEIQSDQSISVDPVIDRDTAGVPGSPDIAATILDKIDKCDVFACDVSIINQDSAPRPAPNPNILIELGYALKRLGWNRILMILNTEFGKAEALPFDLRMKRVLTYTAKKDNQERSFERKQLQSKLSNALREIYRQSGDFRKASEMSVSLANEDMEWHEKMKKMALEGFSKSGFKAYIEAFSTLSPPRITKSQNQLFDAVRKSEIRTFGWPIGVMGENTENMRPKPLSDGIVNSIASSDHKSYDFWALRKNGSFYLLKTLFEDMNSENQVFFNTRIVRTSEMLMFLSRLYENLGVSKKSVLSFSLRHAGLADRLLSSIGNRSLFRKYGPSAEDEITTEISSNLLSLDENISPLVAELLSPVFLLFDFFEIEQNIYDDIVQNFKEGRVT